jgi:hypothetical protein
MLHLEIIKFFVSYRSKVTIYNIESRACTKTMIVWSEKNSYQPARGRRIGENVSGFGSGTPACWQVAVASREGMLPT